jgi:putative transposase
MHLIQRGNNRTTVFHDARDFERYREALHAASRRFHCAIHAYVFMTNHIHLLITPEDRHGPALVIQAVGREFVRWFNDRHHRTGTMWEGRFKSSVISSERYLLTCIRYIELNPVRAHMVGHPSRYYWSSHRHNAHGEPDALITPHPLYDALGPNSVDRQAAYRALFREHVEPQTLDRLRRATNRGIALSDRSLDEQIQATKNPSRSRPHPGDLRSPAFRGVQGAFRGSEQLF